MVREISSDTTLYLVNVRSDEILKYSKLHRRIQAYAKITSIKKIKLYSVLIFEDIVNLLPKEEICLRHFLNYLAHHRRLKIFCVSHTVHKTRMFATIPLFNYIVFTSCVANTVVMRNVFQSFKIVKAMITRWILTFSKHAKAKKYKDYFFFDSSKMIFFKALTSGRIHEASKIVSVSQIGDVNDVDSSSDETDSNSEKEKKIKAQFDSIFKFHETRHQASALFSIVVKVLPLKCVNDADLTLTFKSKKSKNKSISLVDYVHSLLSSSSAAVDSDLLVLHEYIRRRCKIPSMFQVNSKFVRARVSTQSSCPTVSQLNKNEAFKKWGTGTRARKTKKTFKQ